MKKIVLPIFALALFTACGSNDAKEKGETAENTNDITQNPNYQKGLALVTKNDCFTCHKIDATLTGPPYREVANKYAGMPDTIIQHLAKKVISGGTGVWGQVFMTPHPGVSEADAEAMVKYILLLKK